MPQAHRLHRAIAAALLGVAGSAQGQPPATRLADRPGAVQLLQVPISGNPMGAPTPAIGNPVAGNPDAVVQGEKLYNGLNCSGCHAPRGGGGMGPPLSDRNWIYGADPAAIYLSIVQGRPDGMPSWGRTLPPEAVWNLVAYIESLGGVPPPEPRARTTPGAPRPNPLGLP